MKVRILRGTSAFRVWALAATLAATLACAEHGNDDREAEAYDPHRAASDCESCHPNHVREWRISPHAYAMIDPVFHAMVRLGQAETEGKLDQFCTECHSPIGVETGETAVYFDQSLGAHRQKTEGLGARSMAGVSCEACHSMVDVEERANAGFVLALDGVRRASIFNPAPTPAHRAEYNSLFAKSEMCGTCHVVVNEQFTRRVAIEETFVEWMQSSFPGQKECQDCHMSEYEGRAARGGPERMVHRHLFVGVDVPLVPEDAFPGYFEMRDATRELLEQSAVLTATVDPAGRRLNVAIENLAGHALPSGATADREMWLEVLVRDQSGTLVFETGTLDEEGDLRVDDPARTIRPGTDPALVLYAQQMFFDPALETPPLEGTRRRVDFLWQPNDQVSRLVLTGGTDEIGYDLSALGSGTYSATVRLLFRSFSPHLLRRLEREAGLDPDVRARLPIVEMQATTVTIELP